MKSGCQSCALAAASSSALGINRRKITHTSTSIWAMPVRSAAPIALRYSVSIRAWAHTKLIRQIVLTVTGTELNCSNAASFVMPAAANPRQAPSSPQFRGGSRWPRTIRIRQDASVTTAEPAIAVTRDQVIDRVADRPLGVGAQGKVQGSRVVVQESFALPADRDDVVERVDRILDRLEEILIATLMALAPSVTRKRAAGLPSALVSRATLPAITDGTSNTILVVEAHPDAAVDWTKPDDLMIDFKDPLKGLKSARTEGFHALLCDGSVRFIGENLAGMDGWSGHALHPSGNRRFLR